MFLLVLNTASHLNGIRVDQIETFIFLWLRSSPEISKC